ncbi:MAG: hypothetical protein GW949_00865 [Spirochaetales bacterium]|nr:hypothetical protein [Spirochaetales bacterium]
MKETDLYGPLKTYFEGQGAQVAGEVEHTDMVVLQGTYVFGIELKVRFNLTLVYQMLDRRGVFDGVYAAVPLVKGRLANRKKVLMLLSSLGFGLIGVDFFKKKTKVEIILQCNKKYNNPHGRSKRRERIIREINSRYAEFTPGGVASTGPRLTAYRQQSLHVAWLIEKKRIPGRASVLLANGGPTKGSSILQRNIHGWYSRESRGLYILSNEGKLALANHVKEIEELEPLWESYLSRTAQ